MRKKVALISRDEVVRAALAHTFAGAPASWQVALYERPPEGADVVVCGPDVEVPGGLRFDPATPQGILDEVAARTCSALGGVFVVTGAGGGLGTTTISLHLAAEFARRRRTCVVDLDPGPGALARLGIEDIEPGAVPQPAPAGFRVVRPAAEDDAGQAMERWTTDFERIVADLPSGRAAVDACGAATVVLVVAPTPVGAARAADFLAAAPRSRCAIVVNRLGPGGETTIRDVERAIGRRVAVELPCCPALRDAEDEARLLNGLLTRWSRRIAKLARALEQP